MSSNKSSDPVNTPDYSTRRRLASGSSGGIPSSTTPPVSVESISSGSSMSLADMLSGVSPITFEDAFIPQSSEQSDGGAFVCKISAGTGPVLNADQYTIDTSKIGSGSAASILKKERAVLILPEVALDSEYPSGAVVVGHAIKVSVTGGS